MHLSAGAPRRAPPAAFLHRLLRHCLDIRAIWSIGHGADAATLKCLRKSDDLHCDEVELLVVVDGDAFENAWGEEHLSGSLSRWAWREVSADHAFYDESRWAAESSDAGAVTRVRREAHLIWRLAEPRAGS
jgi:hypothetical protein